MVNKKLCFHMGYAAITETNYGSEISLLNLAKMFNKYYDVFIFSANCQTEKILDEGIRYAKSLSFESFSKDNEIDILIVSRYLNVFIDNTMKANKIYIWAHDVCFQSSMHGQTMRDNGLHLYNNVSNKVDGVIVLSEYHKKNMMNLYGIPENKIHIIGHGIDKILVDNNSIEKVKHRFIYTSCPTRGLDLLLKIFPKIHDEFADAELYIYREISKEQLEEVNKYSYIHSMGFQPHDKIREAFSKSSVWLYPTIFVETFCMSALEAQSAGCLCITTGVGSLVEIVGNRGILIDNCEYGSDQYIDKVLKNIRVFFNSDLYNNKIVKGKDWADDRTWDNVSIVWLTLFGYDFNGPKKFIPSVPSVPTFVISLQKQPQKWEKCYTDLVSTGFKDIYRVGAIDGETLVWGTELQKYFVLHEDNYKWIPHNNNAGIFGCAMSHVKLWEKLAECSDDTVWMIVEDDMVPDVDFSINWTRIYNSIKDDKDWDMCYLGYLFFGEKNILSTDKLINNDVYQLTKSDERLTQNCGGTICYVIRASGAKKLLNIVKEHKIHRAIDWFIIDYYDQICTYLCWPLIVHPRDTDKSTVQGIQKTIPGINIENIFAKYGPIEKKIHISWKNKDIINKDFTLVKNGIKNLRDMNPEYEFTISDDYDVDQYLKSKLSSDDYDLFKDVDIVPKTDIWKLLKIYYEGGVFVNVDRFVNIPLSNIILEDTKCVLPTYFDIDCSQDIMISCSGNILHKTTLDLSIQRRREGCVDTMFLGPHTYFHAITKILLGESLQRAPPLKDMEMLRSVIEGCKYLKTYREHIPYNTILYKGDELISDKEDMYKDDTEKKLFHFVDKVVYINLESRKNKRDEIEKELYPIIEKDKIIRFNAIDHKMGNIGCSLSHIGVLEMAIENKWKNLLVFEDDAIWKNFDDGYKLLEKLIEKPYDVIVLGTHIRSAIIEKDTYRVRKGNMMHAYIVSSRYYETLLSNYKEGVEKLISEPDKYMFYNCDMYSDKLKTTDEWYCVYPALCIQRAGFSDTEGRFTNYESCY